MAWDPRRDMQQPRIKLALDQNFPVLILNASEFLPELEIVPVQKIDSRLSELDDRKLISPTAVPTAV